MKLTRKEQKFFETIKNFGWNNKATVRLVIGLLMVGVPGILWLIGDANPLIVAFDGEPYFFHVVGVGAASSGAVFVLSVPIFMLLSRKSTVRRTREDFSRIEANHGDLDTNIKQFIREYNFKKGSIAVTEAHGHVTQEWYCQFPIFGLGAFRLIKLTDIVAIFGSMEHGTRIILNDGSTIIDTFGPGRWQAVYDAFVRGNPFIVGDGDWIEDDHGERIDLYDLFFSDNVENRGLKFDGKPSSEVFEWLMKKYEQKKEILKKEQSTKDMMGNGTH